MAKELNQFEKAGLLAIKDHYSQDGYDKEFYRLLQTTEGPHILIIEERIRQAITKFIPEYRDHLESMMSSMSIDKESIIQAVMTCSLLKGYELGRKLRRPLSKRGRR